MAFFVKCDFFQRARVSPSASGRLGANRRIALIASLALSHTALSQIEFGYDPTSGTLPARP